MGLILMVLIFNSSLKFWTNWIQILAERMSKTSRSWKKWWPSWVVATSTQRLIKQKWTEKLFKLLKNQKKDSKWAKMICSGRSTRLQLSQAKTSLWIGLWRCLSEKSSPSLIKIFWITSGQRPTTNPSLNFKSLRKFRSSCKLMTKCWRKSKKFSKTSNLKRHHLSS